MVIEKKNLISAVSLEYLPIRIPMESPNLISVTEEV